MGDQSSKLWEFSCGCTCTKLFRRDRVIITQRRVDFHTVCEQHQNQRPNLDLFDILVKRWKKEERERAQGIVTALLDLVKRTQKMGHASCLVELPKMSSPYMPRKVEENLKEEDVYFDHSCASLDDPRVLLTWLKVE